MHGIQGETADAAVVGPDVDAAGLYVGLTRGSHQNVAITVARTDEEAIAQVGATMMRGTTELTIQDAMRAAHAELRRAARERELQASAQWTTPSSSPSRGGFSLQSPARGLLARRFTPGMTATIKVSDELRDRLKEQAAVTGSHSVHTSRISQMPRTDHGVSTC